jgi:type II secretory pathway component PulF
VVDACIIAPRAPAGDRRGMTSAAAALRALDDSRHRAEFYRMWHAGFSAAFTHPQTLETMATRESAGVEDARRWVLGGVKRGRGVTETVRAGGDRFDDFERALIALGEESGRLEHTLRLLADYFTRKHRFMLWVKKQMAYPMMTTFAACFIAPFPLLFYGYPAAYFASAISAAALLVAGGGALVIAASKTFGRKPHVARALFTRALAMAIEAGLPLDRALRLAADASANDEIRAYFDGQSNRVLGGTSIAATLAACPHVTPELLTVIDTAERTGDFTVVTRLADLYEGGFK